MALSKIKQDVPLGKQVRVVYKAHLAAQIRQVLFDVLPEVALVLKGEKEWTPTQAALFQTLFNGLGPSHFMNVKVKRDPGLPPPLRGVEYKKRGRPSKAKIIDATARLLPKPEEMTDEQLRLLAEEKRYERD